METKFSLCLSSPVCYDYSSFLYPLFLGSDFQVQVLLLPNNLEDIPWSTSNVISPTAGNFATENQDHTTQAMQVTTTDGFKETTLTNGNKVATTKTEPPDITTEKFLISTSMKPEEPITEQDPHKEEATVTKKEVPEALTKNQVLG